MLKGFGIDESRYFDSLVEKCGEVWWGNRTKAGIERQDRRAKIVSELLDNYNSPLVLELGCANGMFSRHVLKELSLVRLIGCDISQSAIKMAKERNLNHQRANYLINDASLLPYKNEIFDAVIGNSILHHVPVGLVLNECYRVLKPGGIIWFSEPNMLNPQIFIEKNFYFIGRILQNSKDESAFYRWLLRKKISKIGFYNVIVIPFDFLHPLIPGNLINLVNKIGLLLERIPIIKEFAGSLFITANKHE